MMNDKMRGKKECCPSTSIGERIADASYVIKGEWETWTPKVGKSRDSIRVYVVNASKKTNVNTIVVAHDIFGPTSGRLVEICDEIARDLDVRVVMPDFFHGKPFLDQKTYAVPVPPNDNFVAKCSTLCRLCCLCGICRLCCSLCCDRRRMYWDRVAFDFEEIVLDRLGGKTSVGVLGFCWGGWFAFRASSHPSISCAVTCHPSLDVCRFTGEDMETVCDMIQCPQLVRRNSKYSRSIDRTPNLLFFFFFEIGTCCWRRSSKRQNGGYS